MARMPCHMRLMSLLSWKWLWIFAKCLCCSYGSWKLDPCCSCLQQLTQLYSHPQFLVGACCNGLFRQWHHPCTYWCRRSLMMYTPPSWCCGHQLQILPEHMPVSVLKISTSSLISWGLVQQTQVLLSLCCLFLHQLWNCHFILAFKYYNSAVLLSDAFHAQKPWEQIWPCSLDGRGVICSIPVNQRNITPSWTSVSSYTQKIANSMLHWVCYVIPVTQQQWHKQQLKNM